MTHECSFVVWRSTKVSRSKIKSRFSKIFISLIYSSRSNWNRTCWRNFEKWQKLTCSTFIHSPSIWVYGALKIFLWKQIISVSQLRSFSCSRGTNEFRNISLLITFTETSFFLRDWSNFFKWILLRRTNKILYMWDTYTS